MPPHPNKLGPTDRGEFKTAAEYECPAELTVAQAGQGSFDYTSGCANAQPLVPLRMTDIWGLLTPLKMTDIWSLLPPLRMTDIGVYFLRSG